MFKNSNLLCFYEHKPSDLEFSLKSESNDRNPLGTPYFAPEARFLHGLIRIIFFILAAVPQDIIDLANGKIIKPEELIHKKPAFLHKKPVPVPKFQLPAGNAWRHRAPPTHLPENLQRLVASAAEQKPRKPVFTIIPSGMGKPVSTKKVFDPLSVTSTEPVIQGFTAPKVIIDLVHQSPEWKKLALQPVKTAPKPVTIEKPVRINKPVSNFNPSYDYQPVANYKLEVIQKPVHTPVTIPVNQPVVVRGCHSSVGCAVFPSETNCGSTFTEDCYVVSTGKAIDFTGIREKETGTDFVPHEVLLTARSHWKDNAHLDHGKTENNFFPRKIVPAQNPLGY